MDLDRGGMMISMNDGVVVYWDDAYAKKWRNGGVSFLAIGEACALQRTVNATNHEKALPKPLKMKKYMEGIEAYNKLPKIYQEDNETYKSVWCSLYFFS